MKFFHHPRHKQYFPLVLILLTLGLILFMVFAFSGSRAPDLSPKTDSSVQAEPAVTDEEYRINIHGVIAEYEQSLPSAASDLERLALLERTLDRVLAARVSSGYRQLHLEIATSLHQMIEGLRGTSGAFESGQARMEAVIEQNPWLR